MRVTFLKKLIILSAMVCRKCHGFKVFGDKCWFYWDGKKRCSQFRGFPEEEPRFEFVEDDL